MKPQTKTKPLPQEYRWDTIPEILYEAPTTPGEPGSPMPYIEVPKEKKMPPVLFIFEYKLTGEIEPDEKGRPQEIVDQIPHRFVDMEFLLERLNNVVIEDKIRCALGMQPKAQAKANGEKILAGVFGQANKIKEDLLASQDERMDLIKQSIDKVKANQAQ